MLSQMLQGSANKRNQVGMVTSYPHAYRCKFTPSLLLRSDNFLVVPLMNEKQGGPDVCSQRHACYCSRKRACFSPGEKKASLRGGLKGQQFSCFCPCSAIALRHFRQQSVCNRGESILWSKGSSIFGWVHILPQFLSHCHQITCGPFLQCQCVSPVSTRVGQKGKILDYAVFVSLNLKFWFM